MYYRAFLKKFVKIQQLNKISILETVEFSHFCNDSERVQSLSEIGNFKNCFIALFFHSIFII